MKVGVYDEVYIAEQQCAIVCLKHNIVGCSLLQVLGKQYGVGLRASPQGDDDTFMSIQNSVQNSSGDALWVQIGSKLA